ncbi:MULTISPECIES: SRPBCC family protein [Pseudomonas]|uniref:SRPBCC family protein n=1 Tax=Pseudomonas izuensis TaxID=2684212 RepID=A0ABM7RWF8_9PSED|nr:MULTISPECIES: SRPBCC family protein [Pseudomonas]RKS24402.1 polyketide cyclase/dehydrase/lipid transport protein [Pseudomonas sp. WPR_5_2]BCX69453.1 SRPBCC family protein [Pseudomonas izuensis]
MSAIASHSVLLDLSLPAAWAKLRDLSLAPHYVPGLTGCQFHPGAHEGVGASRRVFRKGGQWLDETVVQWQEGVGFVLVLHKASGGAPFPFREACFSYTLQAEGDATRITTRMSYSLRGGRLVEGLLGKAFNKVVREIALNLKAYYETGKTQNADLVQGRTLNSAL